MLKIKATHTGTCCLCHHLIRKGDDIRTSATAEDSVHDSCYMEFSKATTEIAKGLKKAGVLNG